MNRKMMIAAMFLIAIVGAAVIYPMLTAEKEEIKHDWAEDSKNELDGQSTVSVKFKDRNDQYVNVQHEAYSFLLQGVEVSKIEITISYKVEGTNLDLSTLNVEYSFTVSHNLDSASYVVITSKQLSSAELQDSYTYVLDLESYFSRFLGSEEAQNEYSFNIKINAQFAVTASSNAGQYLTADDTLDGIIPLVWSPDSVSIVGSFVEGEGGTSTTTTTTGGGKTTVMPYSLLFGGGISLSVAIIFTVVVLAIIVFRRS